MSPSPVETLATLYGLTTRYLDASNKLRTCSDEAIMAVLRILGADITRPDDAPAQIELRRTQLWEPGLPAVVTVWDNEPGSFVLQAPASKLKGIGSIQVELEQGETLSVPVRFDECPTLEITGSGKSKSVRIGVPLPPKIPVGYHTLHLEAGPVRYTSLLLSAPAKATAPQIRWQKRPPAGAFLPLYSAYSAAGIGLGNLSDLEKWVKWASECGLGFFATLPLLSTFLTNPFEPSPYAPASRLFWNELVADVRHGGLLTAPPGLSADEVQQAVASAHQEPFVDYPKQHKLQFQALKSIARQFFCENGPNSAEFQAFLAEYPDVYDYAAFRAFTDTTGQPWPQWSKGTDPAALAADGALTELKNAYVMAQYLCHQQLGRIGNNRAGLYLDLPVGVHPDSYDVWKHRDLFAVGAAAGAPPDPLFSKGQNWGFPPMHPVHLSMDHYGYFRAMVRRPMRYAAMVRLDHVMSIHRMYWVPENFKATDGVYVHYPAQDLAAILCIESARTGCVVAGEDLGTVPEIIRDIMRDRGMLRLYVGQFSVSSDPKIGLVVPPPHSIACLNTHDMPPFAAFWRETDLDDQVDLGLLDESEEQHERQRRKTIRKSLLLHLLQRGVLSDDPSLEDILAGLLIKLSESNATCVVVNLEDLCLELIPQNTPGTWKERPNWRRRARYSLEKFIDNPKIAQMLAKIVSARPQIWHDDDE